MDESGLYLGRLVSFDAGSYTAVVELRGSTPARLAGVAVCRGLPAAELLAGRLVAVWGLGAGPAVLLAVWE